MTRPDILALTDAHFRAARATERVFIAIYVVIGFGAAVLLQVAR